MKVSMLRGLGVSAAAALGLVLVAPSANAQAQASGMRFGVEAALANHSTGFGAGAFVKFHLAEMSEHAITGRVSFDYFFPSSASYCIYTCGSVHYWEASADGLVDIVAKGDAKPYVGAGITYSNVSYGGSACVVLGVDYCASASNTGLDVVGGVNFMANSKLMPFVEVKLGLQSGGNFTIKGGIHF